ncbi:sulfotransferase family protein [Mangrovimonas aestuarii]|uniref:hypothetical protein n=1 Tax=Mangrovimonas aestuarii TaxID=3018443 RepID=UPI002379AECF|nr:hypothetical protein [Mangrovimonas aestuarii]
MDKNNSSSWRLNLKKKGKKNYDLFVIAPLLKTKKFNSTESIVIFSEARGGSTWLMEMLRDSLDLCINWEPLHPELGAVPKDYSLGNRPFIIENDPNFRYKELFKDIFEFKTHAFWNRKYLTLTQLIRGKQVLVKFVRANLLVPYILKNFNFKYPPIFLLRHPIDVCLSKIRVNHKSLVNTHEMEIPNWLNNDRFVKHKDYVDKLETRLEKEIAVWCINNAPVLNKLAYYNLHTIFYSDILIDPKKEMEKLFINYQIDNYEEKLSKINFRKASSTNNRKGFGYQSDVTGQLYKNFEALDLEMKNRIQEIFDYFDLKVFTAYSPLPEKEFLKLHQG